MYILYVMTQTNQQFIRKWKYFNKLPDTISQSYDTSLHIVQIVDLSSPYRSEVAGEDIGLQEGQQVTDVVQSCTHPYYLGGS